MLLISFLWGFIGYSFAQRYLHLETFGAVIVSLVMVFSIIQIERQIILASSRNYIARIFRFFIALVMAIIGSVIIDQILFKDDVEKAQVSVLQKQVDEILPARERTLVKQINALDSAISSKENELKSLLTEIDKSPFISKRKAQTSRETVQRNREDGTPYDTIISKTTFSSEQVENPKNKQVPILIEQIDKLANQKTEKENFQVDIRNSIEEELKSKTGFLDELNILFNEILLKDNLALFIWLCILLFFLSIELFVLVNKVGDSKTDYDHIINHQMDVRIKMIDELSKKDGEKK